MNKRCIYCQTVSDVSDDVIDCPACGNTNKLTPYLSAPQGFVRGKFEPFRSTVDGTLIKNHRDMAEHNKRNDVVCLADGYSDKALKSGKLAQKKSEPITSKRELIDDVMSSAIAVRDGYKPEVQYED